MTALEAALANLAAEAAYLGAVASFPAIRAERRRKLEETERELARAVAEVLSAGACNESRRPADESGNPDCQRGAAGASAPHRIGNTCGHHDTDVTAVTE